MTTECKLSKLPVLPLLLLNNQRLALAKQLLLLLVLPPLPLALLALPPLPLLALPPLPLPLQLLLTLLF